MKNYQGVHERVFNENYFTHFFVLSTWHKICQTAVSILNHHSKNLNNNTMKSLLVALGVLSLTVISCSKSDESLQPNQSEVQSRRHNGGGGTGVISSVPQVTGLSANASGPTSVYLSWNSVPNATAYWIYRDSYVPAIVSGTSYTDGSVSSGTTYTYAIAAVVNSTLGPKSSSVTVTTP